MHFNVQRESFPDSIIANMFSFQEAQMFEVKDDSVREVPKVSFT
jgi:LemA protein